MYLKKIEVQGFKSFANKTVFDFSNGITGIVGPNGSGKSNVSDAVRWVLGEQSAKQLRGGNMQDVIFAGTQLRKPQGFAYVALTMDNTDRALAIDFDEVTISRRLYRSGESEYMMNGSICRMRDIQELFYDTGVGKEGYSIIGQGQVDKILSNKPEDRRELFDEAVGITKYKRRKVLTQRKLESERANLTRINDILAELETRVGPLKKQSDDAKEYLRLRDELKKYEVNLFLRESKALREELGEIEKNEGIVTSDLESANRQAAELRDEYETLENLIRELDETISGSKEDLAAKNIESGDLTGQINVLIEQINSERISSEHTASRLKTIENEVAVRQSSLDEYRAQESDSDASYEKAKTEKEAAEKRLSDLDAHIEELSKRIEDDNAGIVNTIEKRSEIHAEGEKSEALLEQLQLRKAEISQKLLKMKSDLATLQVSHEKSQKAFDDLQNKLDSINDRIYDEEINLGNLRKEVTKAENAVNQSKNKYQSSAAKLESLRNIAERYEGYGNATRKVMETGNSGIHGVVADLINVEKEYEVAIETALGARAQNVVTDTEETAKKLIKYLKENRFGRVTFLPLNSCRAKSWDGDGTLGDTGVVGIASRLVSTDAKYQELAEQLLGRIVVVDTVDHATALQRKHNYSLRIVTLEGELLSPGGSMTGGAFKNTTSLLSRKREIEELEEALKGVAEEVKQAESSLEDARTAVEKKIQDIEDIKQNRQDILIEKNTVQVSFDALKDRLSESSASTTDLDNEHIEIENKLLELSTRKTQAAEEFTALVSRQEEYEEDITDSSAKLEAAKADRESYASELSELTVAAAGHEQSLDYIRQNIARVMEELGTLNAESRELLETADNCEESIAAKQEQIKTNEARIAAIEDEKIVLEQKINDAVDTKESRTGEQRQYFEKRDAIAETISNLDKESFRLQGRKEKCSEKLENQTSYIWNEYELSLVTAEELMDDELGETAGIKRTVDSLKADIRKLGIVNVNAIEEYKEVSERYELMSTQHDDIVAAEEQLVSIIEELDTGMRKQFEENFVKIEREFDKVFKELFGGGSGKLEIEEEEGVDILDAGIIINAQPPGKKLQNMMQLSGGEKALTAISLLFAIQNLRPSPFALLDEIEAALDDSNVDRFAHYLHRLSRNTQFIVITHRRGTMVSADRLYGITMQEKGVSTLVSVNLIEDELDN